ncbi:hypothetical protein [Phocaeicola sp.]
MEIVLLIAGMVAGYYFIKRYDRIDLWVCAGRIKDYEPFGEMFVLLSMLFGALAGCLFFYAEMSGEVSESGNALVLCALTIGCAVYQAFLRLEHKQDIWVKSVWGVMSCFLASVIGFIGSIVVLVIACIFLILMIVGAAAAPGKYTHSVTDEFGNKVRVRKTSNGDLEDGEGRRWRNNNDGTATPEE